MTTLEKQKGILLVVSGAAGTGKGMVDTCLRTKYSDDYSFSVSATTRAPRPGERDGVDYSFVSREEFERKIRDGEMLEYTEYCGNYYGTPKSELQKLEGGKSLILEIEVEGAGNIKRIYPEAVTVFILPPDYDTLYNRLVGRGTNTPEDIANRMKKALVEFRIAPSYDYAVVNADNKVEEAADTINGIVVSEKHKASRGLSSAIERVFPSEKN